MQSVLVTGGAGFIGSHLCDLLLERGLRVHAVDDLRTGNLANLPLSAPHFRFEQLAIGSPASLERLEKLVADANFVFHLASPVGVSIAHEAPGTTVSSIVLAGAQLVDVCRRLHRSMLYTSSSELYGPAPPCPTSEDCELSLSSAPRFSYAIAKLAVEHMVADLPRHHGVPAWIVRLFNIAGPRQRPDAGVVAAFAAQLTSEGGHLCIHGDGAQTRSFLHVSDAVAAIACVAECRELSGRAVNIGGEHCVSIRELVTRMQEECGHRTLFSYRSYDDVHGNEFVPVVQRRPDTRLLREATGWAPRLGLTDIIRDCLEYARRPTETAFIGRA